MSRIKRKFKSFQREEEKPEPYVYKRSDIYYSSPNSTYQSPNTSSNKTDKIPYENDRRVLLELFPGLDFDKLDTYAIFRSHGYPYMDENKEYKVSKIDRAGYIYVTNNCGISVAFAEYCFKPPYKKYDFEVYAKSTRNSVGLTYNKFYKLIGETRNGYEVLDDRNLRSNFCKSDFGYPQIDTKIKYLN